MIQHFGMTCLLLLFMLHLVHRRDGESSKIQQQLQVVKLAVLSVKVEEDVASRLSVEDHRSSVEVELMDLPDIGLRSFTLVMDRAVPPGYLEHFIALGPHKIKATARADRCNATITNSSAEVWLQSLRKYQQSVVIKETFAKDQLMLATEIKPR